MLQQQFGQFDAHAPSAAELAGGTVKILAVEAQTLQRAFQFRLVVEPSHHLQAFVVVGKAFH